MTQRDKTRTRQHSVQAQTNQAARCPSPCTKPLPVLIQRPLLPPSHSCILALVCPPYSRGLLRWPGKELPPLPDHTQSRVSQSHIDASQNQSPHPLYQWSSTFWHQQLISWKTIFLWTRGGRNGFRMIQAQYFYCTLFSNLMLALIWQEVPGQAQSLGTPGCICSNTLQGQYRPWYCVISLTVSSINPTWLPTDLLLVVFGWRTFRHVTCSPKTFMYLHWNRGICLCVSDWHREHFSILMAFNLWVIKLFIPQV